jgi:hypothetical protein
MNTTNEKNKRRPHVSERNSVPLLFFLKKNVIVTIAIAIKVIIEIVKKVKKTSNMNFCE